ncbi:MAG: hypothetical protein U1E36_02055 [Rickettsiales bacterium]
MRQSLLIAILDPDPVFSALYDKFYAEEMDRAVRRGKTPDPERIAEFTLSRVIHSTDRGPRDFEGLLDIKRDDITAWMSDGILAPSLTKRSAKSNI